MSIAADMNDWTAMLYGKNTQQQPAQQTQQPSDAMASSGDDLIESEPVITYDYDAEMKEIRRRARKTVSYLSKLILPKDMLDEEYVKDKIEQDVSSLAELYWTRRSNEIMKKSVMDGIAKGNTAPRMYDVYKDLTNQINENNKQLMSTEDNLRKIYTDLKYEIQRKRVEEMNDGVPQQSHQGFNQTQIRTSQEPIAYTGTKGIIEEMKERQRIAARQTVEVQEVF